jgi:hypothetical protein
MRLFVIFAHNNVKRKKIMLAAGLGLETDKERPQAFRNGRGLGQKPVDQGHRIRSRFDHFTSVRLRDTTNPD